MNSEIASTWFVPANNGQEIAFLIKAPTPSLKALFAGCELRLLFGRKEAHFCQGVRIADVPGADTLIAGSVRETEEFEALVRAMNDLTFPIFAFNEMDLSLMWTTARVQESDAQAVLRLLGDLSGLYVGPFADDSSRALDCFCDSVEDRVVETETSVMSMLTVKIAFEPWRITNNIFVGVRESQTISLDHAEEGETLERAIWASLESVFPLNLHKSPQVRRGGKTRELTDVLSFYEYGSFLIEAKDLSVLQAGYGRTLDRRISGVQGQAKKAIGQLVGASRSFRDSRPIYDSAGTELSIDRSQPPHCIVLITELTHSGDWSSIERLLLEASCSTGSFFQLLDLQELVTLLKGSGGKATLFDYNLLERWKLFMMRRSVHIRSQPMSPPDKASTTDELPRD